MAFLLDTNVLSELRKGAKADANVRRWAATQLGQRHFVSVISLGEIRKGIERLRPKDPVQAEVLERWLGTLKRDFAHSVTSKIKPHQSNPGEGVPSPARISTTRRGAWWWAEDRLPAGHGKRASSLFCQRLWLNHEDSSQDGRFP